jgi:O-antigen/teichoic acid export membrane protein
MSAIRKLFVHFSHFLGGGFVGLLVGLVSFPILTRVLSERQYGVLSLVTIAVSICVALAKGGLSDGIIRFYREYSAPEGKMIEFTSSVLTRGVLLSCVVTGLYVLLVPRINRSLRIEDAILPAFLVMAAYLFIRPLNIIVLNYLRATGRTVFYNGISLFVKVSSALLALSLFAIFSRNITWYFAGVALAEAICGAILFYWLLTNYKVALTHVSPALAWKLVKFGLPLLITELGYLTLQYADRYFLVAYHGEAVLGIYSVGYNLPSYVNDLVLFSVSYAIVPIYTELYASKGREETQAFLNQSFRYYLIGVILLCAGYSAVDQDLIAVLASEKYAAAARFSPLILYGLIFVGMNYILYAGLYLEKRSNLILATMLVSVLVNIALNVLLIPKYASLGAATATLIACVTGSLATIGFSFRYMPVKIPFAAIGYYLALSGAMVLVLEQVAPPNLWFRLTCRVVLGAAICGMGVLIREAEVRAAAARIYRLAISAVT